MPFQRLLYRQRANNDHLEIHKLGEDEFDSKL